ncbi:hypothetical protein GCM10010500_66390 [Streptomyces nigrescens]|nr:hypothetical protein GCM10010500_66390 [Streptomyces libani subsp. libani]
MVPAAMPSTGNRAIGANSAGPMHGPVGALWQVPLTDGGSGRDRRGSGNLPIPRGSREGGRAP